jgi:hypothetical protein
MYTNKDSKAIAALIMSDVIQRGVGPHDLSGDLLKEVSAILKEFNVALSIDNSFRQLKYNFYNNRSGVEL